MKIISARHIFLVLVFLTAGFQLRAQTNAPDSTPQSILNVMQRVADWELAHPTVTSNRPATGWVQAAGNAGMMALAGISGDARYRDAMFTAGETNGWKLGTRLYDADDHCIGQTWAELYLLYRKPEMIVPLREKFDAVLAKPSTVQSLELLKRENPRTHKLDEDPKSRENWAWCDSLFMGPPAWMRLYSATGDVKYMNYAVSNWWRTTAFLYDTNEHLFFRDSSYFTNREANGAKIFWSRGNGWVLAGLVRVLQSLPMNSPDRPRFEKLFTEMAGKILTCQQPDGLWRASLLDPASYPLKETSGSGFYTYALAWGVNQGLLDRAQFEPAIRKAWTALVACVAADGKLTHVQPIGADPKKFKDDSTEVYGTGSFLLAGSEVYRMASVENTTVKKHGWNWNHPAGLVAIKVKNAGAIRRAGETVEVPTGYFFANGLRVNFPQHIAVMDGLSSRILDSQVYASKPDSATGKLFFQVDLAPGETRTFYILDTAALAAVPPPPVKSSAPENVARRFPAPRDPPLQVTIGN